MVKLEKRSTQSILTLSPNRSLTWAEAKWIMAIMTAVVMIIAIAWTFVGAWVVLPFAGVELGLFLLLMYKVTRSTYLKQIITFDNDEIKVEMGINRRLSSQSIPRSGTDIFYSETDRNWTTPKITFHNGAKRLQIGEFLNAEDMALLRERLEDLGFPICREHWWK